MRILAATFITAALTLTLSGCEDPAPRPSAQEAVVFAEGFYTDVLTGKPGVCAQFTEEGREDFIKDMYPVSTCEEGVDVLGNAIGEAHVEDFTGDHEYSVESQTDDTVVVRADFVTYADLMTLEWADGTWKVGPTRRVKSNQPPPTPGPAEDEHAHQH